MQRMHVDWILFAQPLQQLEAGASQITGYITVRQDMVFVAETRSRQFSNDHFAVEWQSQCG